MDRHERQAKLREVGAAGQARLAGACVDVPFEGLAGETAVRYLAGAGVGRLRVVQAELAAVARAVDPAVVVEVVPGLPRGGGGGAGVAAVDLRDETAREVAAGSLAALRELRRILQLERVEAQAGR